MEEVNSIIERDNNEGENEVIDSLTGHSTENFFKVMREEFIEVRKEIQNCRSDCENDREERREIQNDREELTLSRSMVQKVKHHACSFLNMLLQKMYHFFKGMFHCSIEVYFLNHHSVYLVVVDHELNRWQKSVKVFILP